MVKELIHRLHNIGERIISKWSQATFHISALVLRDLDKFSKFQVMSTTTLLQDAKIVTLLISDLRWLEDSACWHSSPSTSLTVGKILWPLTSPSTSLLVRNYQSTSSFAGEKTLRRNMRLTPTCRRTSKTPTQRIIDFRRSTNRTKTR